MLTNQERYFIWSILHPSNELRGLAGLDGQPIYNDDQYSLLKERIGLLCTKVLHIFEQPDFSTSHGTSKRNELNGNDPRFHRVLSYGIKEKHGSINKQYYSNFELCIPLSAYVFSDELMYDYFYHPTLKDGSGNEFSLLEDLSHAVNYLISLYGLNIKKPEPMFKLAPKYSISDNTVNLHPVDTYGYIENGMSSSTNLRTFEISNDDWTPVDLPFQIDFKCISTNSPA